MPRFRCLSVCLVLSAAVFAVLVSPAAAEDADEKKLDVTYVTSDFFAAVVLHPKRILEAKSLQTLPLDEFVATVKEKTGIDPLDIEQAQIYVSLMSVLETDLELVPVAVVVRFHRPIAGKELIVEYGKRIGQKGELGERSFNGKTFYEFTGGVPLSFHLPDERTVLVGPRKYVRRMTAEAEETLLAKKLRAAGADREIVFAVDVAPIRRLFDIIPEPPDDDDWFIYAFAKQLLTKVDFYTATADADDGLRARLMLDSPDEQSARIVADLVRGWLAVIKLLAPAVQEQLKETDVFPPELANNFGKTLPALIQGISVEQKENSVVVSWDLPEDYPVVVASFLEYLREKAILSQSKFNLHQLAFAFHSFVDVHDAFPAQANYDEKGKPLLSWRVHLLPFLEATDLYEEFRLDERWDSPHNKKLMAKMPEVFKSPGKDLGEGKTCYLAVVGENTIFPTKPLPTGKLAKLGINPLSYRSVHDGLSNTLLFVEAAPEEAVIWTKPDDWEIDAKKPRKGLFGMRRARALAAIADGSVRMIPKNASDKAIVYAAGRNDGMPYEFDGDRRKQRGELKK